MLPSIQAVQPGDKMVVEIMAAGVAADELRSDGDKRGEEYDGWASQSPPASGRRLDHGRRFHERTLRGGGLWKTG
jgi:hypothetical protein